MNNWKQMSEQEQAEWLAGFCGFELLHTAWKNPYGQPMCVDELTDFFNSPAGFMAVKNEVVKRNLEFSIHWFRHGELGDVYGVTVDIMIDSNTPFAVKHKDLEEAFYEAVFMSMEGGE
jgi:hypothetical protein